MDKIEKIIKEYLEKDLISGSGGKTDDCLNEQDLIKYLKGIISDETRGSDEHHIASCGFCLSQLSIAFESQLINKKELQPVPQELLDKVEYRLGIGKYEKNKEIHKTKKMKKIFFLAGTIFFFGLSFVVPRYFIQFLVAALILGIRWSLESESGKTLIMIIDSWRRHSSDKDDDISRRLKNRL
ncbi:MAG: hypothetical protein JW734_04775 [Candidatus Omnitrophica bacterium]|nr:hypothetical protein [Candidatus Omnitrophota bacterium]